MTHWHAVCGSANVVCERNLRTLREPLRSEPMLVEDEDQAKQLEFWRQHDA